MRIVREVPPFIPVNIKLEEQGDLTSMRVIAYYYVRHGPSPSEASFARALLKALEE